MKGLWTVSSPLFELCQTATATTKATSSSRGQGPRCEGPVSHASNLPRLVLQHMSSSSRIDALHLVQAPVVARTQHNNHATSRVAIFVSLSTIIVFCVRGPYENSIINVFDESREAVTAVYQEEYLVEGSDRARYTARRAAVYTVRKMCGSDRIDLLTWNAVTVRIGTTTSARIGPSVGASVSTAARAPQFSRAAQGTPLQLTETQPRTITTRSIQAMAQVWM